MRILICGGRNFNDYQKLEDIMVNYPNISTIIHGNAKGADTLGKQWALNNDIPIEAYPAKWSDISHPDAVIKTNYYGKYDAMAGHRRNQQMLDEGKPDIVLALPGGAGTVNMIKKSVTANITVHKVEFYNGPKVHVIEGK